MIVWPDAEGGVDRPCSLSFATGSCEEIKRCWLPSPQRREGLGVRGTSMPLTSCPPFRIRQGSSASFQKSFFPNEQTYFFSLWASFVKRAMTVSTLFSMVLSDLFKSIVSVSYPLQMSMLLRASTISTTRVDSL